MSGGDEYVLPPGQHTFPFSFVLPPSLPSSFEGGIGYVRYLVQGTIDRPWRFDDHTVRPFTVLSALDLNQQPMAGVREFYDDIAILYILIYNITILNRYMYIKNYLTSFFIEWSRGNRFKESMLSVL